MSNILSASSKTKYLTSLNFKAAVHFIWSNSLPGVPTKTLQPFLSLAFSAFLFSPPAKYPGTIHVNG